MLLYPVGKLAHILHKVEAGDRIRYQDARLAAADPGKKGLVFLFMGDLTQIIAVQLVPDFLSAADHIPLKAHHGKQSAGGYSRQHTHFLHGSRGILPVHGASCHFRTLEHLQRNVVHHLIGHILMVIDNGLGHHKCRPGIGSRDRHIQKVGLRHRHCGDGAVKIAALHLLLNILAHQGAVQQFREHRGHFRGG